MTGRYLPESDAIDTIDLRDKACHMFASEPVYVSCLAAFSSIDLSASQQSPQIVEPCVAQDSPTCKLLYVTPEQFCNNTLLQELLVALRRRQLFPRLVIDEVLLATAAAKGTC